jgi:hypothetical protein
MKKPIHQKLNKTNTLFLVMLIGAFLLPNNSYANTPTPERFFVDENRLFGYVSGNSCGDKTCNSDEVCQKEYRGVLPIESDTTAGLSKTTTFTCVKARPIQAPASPFRGETGCAVGPGGGLLGSVLGDTVSGLVGNGLTGLVGGISLVGTGGGLFGLPSAYTFINPNQVITDTLLNGLSPNANFNDLIGFGVNNGDNCESYNNINRVIDTRRLTAPLPVDIFNPLPLPVNVTSPTPLPVVVVDDLALYQQKELIDAPLAAKQKAQTIATISDTLRAQISTDNLIPNNLFDTTKLGIQAGALSTETGVVNKDALLTYGRYQNFSPERNEQLAQYFRDLKDPNKSKLPRETFTEKCGNVSAAQAGEISFECALLVLQTNNNANDIATNVAFQAKAKSDLATDLLKTELDQNGGFFSTTAIPNDRDPFNKKNVTPGSITKGLTDKVVGASIDQAIIASGTNCFEAIPNNILNASLRPVLTQGMFNVNSNVLSSVPLINSSDRARSTSTTPVNGTGTVTTTANGTTVTGTATNFTTTFKVGDTITINGESPKTISAITSNTSLTVSSPFSGTARNNVTYTTSNNNFQNPRNFVNQTGSNFNPDQFFQSLQNTLLQNITNSLSCVFRQQITSLLNGVLGNVNIPGLGNNVTRTITNTVGSTVDRTIREGVNSIVR